MYIQINRKYNTKDLKFNKFNKMQHKQIRLINSKIKYQIDIEDTITGYNVYLHIGPNAILTRGSAVAQKPRDASCH